MVNANQLAASKAHLDETQKFRETVLQSILEAEQVSLKAKPVERVPTAEKGRNRYQVDKAIGV